MNMSRFFLVSLVFLSTNCFADLQYDLDKMEQDRRLYQVERQMQDMEIKQRNEDPYKFYDELHEKITKVG